MAHITFPPIEAVRQTLFDIDTPALDIYTETGLTPSWQQAFREGRSSDPGYSRVCTLIEWLNNKHGTRLTNNVLNHTGGTES